MDKFDFFVKINFTVDFFPSFAKGKIISQNSLIFNYRAKKIIIFDIAPRNYWKIIFPADKKLL